MEGQKYPEPAVGALILNPEGKLFLMRSHKWHGQYVIPGGHIELGETIEEALKREVKEETNLDIHDIEFLLFQEFIFDQSFWKKDHYIFFDYVCRTDSVDVILNDEAEEYVWVSSGDAMNLAVEHYTRVVIEKYLEKVERGSKIWQGKM